MKVKEDLYKENINDSLIIMKKHLSLNISRDQCIVCKFNTCQHF